MSLEFLESLEPGRVEEGVVCVGGIVRGGRLVRCSPEALNLATSLQIFTAISKGDTVGTLWPGNFAAGSTCTPSPRNTRVSRARSVHTVCTVSPDVGPQLPSLQLVYRSASLGTFHLVGTKGSFFVNPFWAEGKRWGPGL